MRMLQLFSIELCGPVFGLHSVLATSWNGFEHSKLDSCYIFIKHSTEKPPYFKTKMKVVRIRSLMVHDDWISDHCGVLLIQEGPEGSLPVITIPRYKKEPGTSFNILLNLSSPIQFNFCSHGLNCGGKKSFLREGLQDFYAYSLA